MWRENFLIKRNNFLNDFTLYILYFKYTYTLIFSYIFLYLIYFWYMFLLCLELFLRYSMCGLGFLLDFISGPVSVGFTSAASIIIATSQVKDILGLKVTGTKFVQVWQSIFEHIGETRRWDTALGIVCIIVLLLLRVSATLFKLQLVV